jgi:DNA-binding SARP family transcriptional activator
MGRAADAGPVEPATRVHLLGQTQIIDRGARLDGDGMGGRRAAIVLSRLAIDAGLTVDRDVLADAVWGEDLPATWRPALRNVISAIRAGLDDAGLAPRVAIRSAADGYVLVLPDETPVDVHEVREQIEQAERFAADGRHEAAVEQARAALLVVDQPVLAGTHGAWVESLRAEVDDLGRRGLRIGCRSALTTGDVESAEQWARKLVTTEPLREEGHRLLMRSLAASGNRGEALQVYERLRSLLEAELGAAPSPDTEALFVGLLGGDATEGFRPSRVRIGANAGRLLLLRNEAPFVGRVDDLADLDSLLDRALVDGPRVVAVSGEPGIGKTRLAAELMASAHARGLQVLYGRNDDRFPVPYGSLLDAVAGFVTTFEDDEVERVLGSSGHVLARVVPALATAVGAAEPTGIPDLDGVHLARALVDALRAATQPTGALVVLDDLHWAARSEIDALTDLGEHLGRAPLLVVALHRHVDDPVAVALHGTRATDRIELGALGVEDVAELAEQLNAAHAPDAATVWRASGGNPLLATELLGRPSRPGSRAGRTPLGLTELVEDRLSSLPEGADEVLRTAAIAGQEFDPRIVTAASGVDPDIARAVFDVAHRTGLLVSALERSGWLAFRHGLVRAVLVDRVGDDERLRLHQRIGAALEDAPNAASEGELAYHFGLAAPLGVAPRALRYGLRVARAAFEAGVYDDVVEIAGRTIASVVDAGDHDPRGRLDLEILRGGAERAIGEPTGIATLQAAFAAARDLDDAGRMADAALAFTHAGAATEELFVDDLLLPLYEEALAALGPHDAARRARLLGHLACGRSWRTNAAVGWRSAAASLSLAREVGDAATLLAVTTTARRALSGSTELDLRDQLERELVTLADRFDDPGAHTRAALWRFETEVERGRGENLDALIDLANTTASALRMGHYHHSVAYEGAAIQVLRGEPRAEEAIEEAAVVGHRHGLAPEIVEAIRLTQLVGLRVEQGRVSEIRDEAIAFFAGSGLPEWLGMVALIEGEAGNLDAVPGALDPFLAHSARTGRTIICAPSLVAMAALPIWRTGDVERARALHTRLSRSAGHGGFVAHFVGPIDYWLALLASTLARPDDARQHLTRATQFCARLGAPRWEVRCREALDGDRRRARRPAG